ncbi:MAG: DUF4399 domain-containing protein [Rubrivivax sp.]|nr:DUF4399 domain-containing protein [Rubrivivax sp.]
MLPAPAAATALPAGELEQRCWHAYTRERTRVDTREPREVSFANLRDGYRVASPVLVQFAVRGMGVAPAGVAKDGTGHHHVLVNKALPLDVKQQIPFDDSHRHFGKGQTEALLDLPPGRHKLRLLFADHEHRPHFVYSREITIQVQGSRSQVPRPRIDAARFEATCAAWYEDEVSRPRPPETPLHFTNVRAGELLTSPFNVRLGVDGFGVCAAGLSAPKTGHFVLDVVGGGRAPLNFNLANGATQVNLFVGVGDYRLRLRFVDDKGADLLPAHEMPVRVVAQEPG